MEEAGFLYPGKTTSLAITSWNCQGLGNPTTVLHLQEIKRNVDPDILFLMETKNPNDFVLKKLEQLGYESHHLFSPRDHGAGGLALFWTSMIKIDIVYSNANLIDIFIEYEEKGFFASFVHSDCDRKQRKLQWGHFLNLASARDSLWFVTGNFNDLLYEEKKLGGPARPDSSFVDLRIFFSKGDPFDLRDSGDPLSWRGQLGDYLVKCRLDKAVANSLWAETYPTARCQYLDYEGSDHKPKFSFFEPDSKRRKGMFRYEQRLNDNGGSERSHSKCLAKLKDCDDQGQNCCYLDMQSQSGIKLNITTADE